ncbi:amidase family protein [Variovorax paradoxus]|uniref:amidase family protein n=1 Tax=Variovorax paradoxus TaxID=34073 RepID=UPI0024794908
MASAAVASIFDAAVARLADGFDCEAVAAPRLFDATFEAFAQIVLAEGGIEHFRRSSAERIASHYGRETIERLERAKALTLGDYAHAQQARREFTARLQQAMAPFDVLVLPTCPCTAPRVGEDEVAIGPWRGSVREALMRYTAPFNLAGFPALSIPLAAPDGGLPAALQIVARPGHDGALLRTARRIEALLRPERPCAPAPRIDHDTRSTP